MNKSELVEIRRDKGRKLFKPAKMLALKRGKRYPKKHGSVMIYTDSLIEVRYDTYAPNLSVSVNGQRVLTFQLGHIQRFIPDEWVEHLEALARPILAAEEQRLVELENEREIEYLANWGLE